MKVEWKPVDLKKIKEDLPHPLNVQSGGHFWVSSDGGIHGVRVHLSHWTGSKFIDLNNDLITHFAKVEDWPEPPKHQ